MSVHIHSLHFSSTIRAIVSEYYYSVPSLCGAEPKKNAQPSHAHVQISPQSHCTKVGLLHLRAFTFCS